jgi:hypothetical protein
MANGYFFCRLSNLLSITNKRDLIAAFHVSGTGKRRDPRLLSTHPLSL